MKIKKFFESQLHSGSDEDADEINKDLISALLYSADDKIIDKLEPQIDFIVFLNNKKKPVLDTDYMQWIDCDIGEDIKGVGFRVLFSYDSSKPLSIIGLGEFSNIINTVHSLGKRLSDNYECICSFSMSDWSISLVIRKLRASKNDYYYIFFNEVDNYKDEWFESCQIIKESNDRYLELKTLIDMDQKQQIQHLADFMGTHFDTIKFEKFIYLDKRTFRLKNPKMDSLKLTI